MGNVLKGDSCNFSHDQASGKRPDQRREGQSSSLRHRRRHRLAENFPQTGSRRRGEVFLEQEVRFRADISSSESVRARHVFFGTLPCVLMTSLSRDAHMAKSADSDTLRLMGSPPKNRTKVVWGISCLLEGVFTIRLWVSRFSSDKISYKERRKFWIKSHRQILQRHVAPLKKLGKERVHREASFKSLNLTSPIRGLLDLRKEHRTKFCTKKDAVAWNLAKNVNKLQNTDKATFYSPFEAWVMPAPSSTKPEERELVVDSGASMHMLSKKDLKLRRNGDSAEIKEHHNGGDGQWGSANKWGKHKYTFTILTSSWRCTYSMTRVQFYRWESPAKNTDIFVSGPAVKGRTGPNKGRRSCAKRNFFRTFCCPWIVVKFWYQLVLKNNFEEIQDLFGITQRLILDHQAEILNVSQLFHGRDLFLRTTKWVRGQKQKFTSTQIPYYSWGTCQNIQKRIKDGKIKLKKFDSPILTENYMELMEKRLGSSEIETLKLKSLKIESSSR